MTIRRVLFGCTTQIVKSLAKLLLQVVGPIILMAEEDDAALSDYGTIGQFVNYIRVEAFGTVGTHLLLPSLEGCHPNLELSAIP